MFSLAGQAAVGVVLRNKFFSASSLLAALSSELQLCLSSACIYTGGGDLISPGCLLDKQGAAWCKAHSCVTTCNQL